MGRIRMLSDGMIGKIAAGEVVERPVSALKELIENSLDAGATAVTAEIREGGLSYLRVTDNGSGIEESDLRMAFERHATSKISREADLYAIQTLGFRGEALASIAAVSHVVMTTRTAGRETGLKVVNEGGKILDISEAACTQGTTLVVTDLFFNTPVRKGFMKKASAEAAAVTEVMTQFILSRPEVSFRYLSNGKTIYHSPGDGQLASAVQSVFGTQTARNMRKAEGHENGILLKGYIGIGEDARGNRGQEYFFINGRMMHSSLLSTALEVACRERVMIGKFPICALHLQIPYEAVDVNVHPNKLEVRFRDEAGVSEAVTTLVLEALKEADAFEKPVEMVLTPRKKEPEAPIPAKKEIREGLEKSAGVTVTVSKTLPPEAEKAEDAPRAVPVPRETPVLRADAGNGVLKESTAAPGWTGRTVPDGQGSVPEVQSGTGRSVPGVRSGTEGTVSAVQPRREEKAEQVSTILPKMKKPMKIFGALFHTYILLEYEDQLLMIDQHAVHERLLFDRLMKETPEEMMGQELLVPIILGVTKKETALLEENREALASIGLTVEPFGEHDAAVRTIPMVLGEAATADFVRDILEELESGRNVTADRRRAALLQSACKHAVKGGEALPEDVIRSLVEEMLEKHVTPTCPHGRPLVVSISHRELDRKFKRIQE